MIPKTLFYFIRHGQTSWNAEHRAMGLMDIPLSPLGEMQSKKALQYVKDLNIETICHSPLKRAKQTAEIINEGLQCNMVPIEELKEFNLGAFTGKIIGKWFNQWLNGSLIPEGESFEEFVQRALMGVYKSLVQKGPILIVAHGGIYWAIQRAMQLHDLPDVANCVLTSFSPPKSLKGKWSCSQII
jgi:broad specificity phosphatase PhoE